MASGGSSEKLVKVKFCKGNETRVCMLGEGLAQHLQSEGCDEQLKQTVIDLVFKDEADAGPSKSPSALPLEKSQHCDSDDDEVQVHIWTEREEKALIAARTEMDHMFHKNKNHDSLWSNILKELKKLGINVTLKQLKNKWNQMKKKYKKTVDDNNKTGKEKSEWRHLDAFDNLFGNRASTRAMVSFDSGEKKLKRLNSDKVDQSVSNSESEPMAKIRKQSTSKVDELMEKTDSLISVIKTQHEQKLDRMDRFLDLFQKSLDKKD